MALDPATTGALIKGGLSLAGSLLGNKDKPVTMDKHHFQAIRKSAERAGINPLTAIGASSGVSGISSGPHPALGSLEALGQIAGDIGDHKQNQLDIERQEQSAIVELDRLRSDVRRPSLRAASSSAGSGPSDNGLLPGVGIDRVGNPTIDKIALGPFGDVDTNPNTSDAENAETRYGEIMSEVVGLSNVATDFGAHFGTGIGRQIVNAFPRVFLNQETFDDYMKMHELRNPGLRQEQLTVDGQTFDRKDIYQDFLDEDNALYGNPE